MEYAIRLLDTYPKAKCLSNTRFAYQDVELAHWKQLIDYKTEVRQYTTLAGVLTIAVRREPICDKGSDIKEMNAYVR